MNAAQCRAARHLLGWSSSELAHTAGVPVGEVRRFEDSGSTDGEAMPAIDRVFTAAGVEFAGRTYAGSGVRLRRRLP